MGKLSDAIRDTRRRRQRRIGFSTAAADKTPSMLIGVRDGAIGAAGADFWSVEAGVEPPSDDADVRFWGVRLPAADAVSAAAAAENGAAYVAFSVAEAQADALLNTDIEYIVVLGDADLDEQRLRALASLRPTAALAPAAAFPLSVAALVELRRVAMLIGAPLGIAAPADIAASDLELLRDSGVVGLLLSEADADQIAALRQRIIDLPERKPRRDSDDVQPLLPTTRLDAGDDDEELDE